MNRIIPSPEIRVMLSPAQTSQIFRHYPTALVTVNSQTCNAEVYYQYPEIGELILASDSTSVQRVQLNLFIQKCPVGTIENGVHRRL